MDPQGLYHPGEVGLAQSKQLGGLGLVSTRSFQGLADQSGQKRWVDISNWIYQIGITYIAME